MTSVATEKGRPMRLIDADEAYERWKEERERHERHDI
jgi:hypothetical protein